MKEWRRLARSFGYAIEGIVQTVKTQRNMQIHLVAAILALAAAWWLEIDRVEWIWVLIAITLVLVMELVNTAIEAVVDLVTPDWHAKAKVAKDAAAGAVLAAAILSIAIGIAVFGPPLYEKFVG
ncbi:diacylglycerol kinase [Brevibacillus panacihumi W25]|uniref:Diacylglycerol kinase n=1 Tax=Brevibacillus panacihumi W25 TaxID=1408254 RepID=V6MCV9_9BACL|nr:diacylglycerol kinase family protein [Brevibacillus panacihumi]EST56386.1 diacylglycerol kinase [Brevibacillus panacihumi W25]